LQPLRLAFLATTVAGLLWKAEAIPPVWIMVLGLMWAGLGLYWVSPRKATGSGEYGFYRLVRLLNWGDRVCAPLLAENRGRFPGNAFRPSQRSDHANGIWGRTAWTGASRVGAGQSWAALER
jgi:hypothetical protein